MNKTLAISGIHHITAITGSAAANLAFYETILGLHLVKQTVNFDDPFTYHLYYGDEQGTPGTILTFFPWQNLPRGMVGSGMVSAVAFSIPHHSVDSWRKRLHRYAISTTTETRFGETVLSFSDPDGLRLELIAAEPPEQSASAAYGNAERDRIINGFHSATEVTTSLNQTNGLLVETLGMMLHGQEGNRYRYRMPGESTSARWYDLVIDPTARSGRQGTGTVHHIAFRTADGTEQLRWQRLLQDSGHQVTPVRDRKYFTSIYFHEPGGVLFEIATDAPGFTVDEPLGQLGRSLQLPSHYESQRDTIVSGLPPLRPTTFIHRYIEAPRAHSNERTIVALHGTGGDENDLVPLAQQIGTGSAIISPRGHVVENGTMNRFFRRLANGVFDERDLIRRTHQLADFLAAAAAHYRRDPDHLVALGYSNGATMSAAALLVRPELFSRAILLRPMLPLRPESPVDLSDKHILVLRGSSDTVIPRSSTDDLIDILARGGADVEVVELQAGHELTDDDADQASRWLSRTVSAATAAGT